MVYSHQIKDTDVFKSFSLNISIDISNKKEFEYLKDFNPEEKFEHAFRIITDGTEN
jgi:hypothetical protein